MPITANTSLIMIADVCCSTRPQDVDAQGKFVGFHGSHYFLQQWNRDPPTRVTINLDDGHRRQIVAREGCDRVTYLGYPTEGEAASVERKDSFARMKCWSKPYCLDLGWRCEVTV